MYLNIIQLSESMGVSERVVQDWVRADGLPCMRDGARLLFDRAQVIAWATHRGLAARVGFLNTATPNPAARAPLVDLLRTGGIWRDVAASEATVVMARCVDRLDDLSPQVRQMLAQRLRTPDALSWAPVGEGLAMPHLRTPVTLGASPGLLAILMLREAAPLPEPAPDGIPVRFLFFFLAPSPRLHLQTVGQLSTHLLQGGFKALLEAGAPDEQILAALAAPPTRECQPPTARAR